MAQQQVQAKDMPPRFSKKGQLNADEVTGTICVWLHHSLGEVCMPGDYKKTRYSEEQPVTSSLLYLLLLL